VRSVSQLLRALETFKALRIDFVSYSEQMDTSTPAGKMVSTVLGAAAVMILAVRAAMRVAEACPSLNGLTARGDFGHPRWKKQYTLVASARFPGNW